MPKYLSKLNILSDRDKTATRIEREAEHSRISLRTARNFSVSALSRSMGKLKERFGNNETLAMETPQSIEDKPSAGHEEKEETKVSNTYERMSDILSDEYFRNIIDERSERLAQSPRLRELFNLSQTEDELWDTLLEAQHVEDTDAEESARAKIKSIDEVKKNYTDDEEMKVYGIKAAIEAARHQYARLDKSDTVAHGLLELLDQAEIINTQEQPLEERDFFKPPGVPTRALEATITSRSNELFEVPLGLFIHAGQFNSWMGRGEQGSGFKDHDDVRLPDESEAQSKTSHQVIREYAARDTDLPPVEEVRVFIQPNGKLYCSVPHDSHRTAAAMLRGHHTLRAKKVRFARVEVNYI